jgi:predicted Zn-dependent protease
MQNRGFNLIPLVIGLIAIAFMAARGCEEGPFGRHRVVNLSVKDEFQLGAQAYDKILRDERGNVVERGAIVDVVRRVGRRLADASTDKELRDKMGLKAMDFEWKFNVVESKQINAFCLPGGKVVVYTGILPVCRTEGGLATVMGHEIGHALARHGAERISQQQLVTIGQTAVAVSVSEMDPKKRAAVMGALGVGSQVGVILPFSRAHESEADHIGILLMARAGFDPSEAPEFWQRMDKATVGGKRQAEFLSTHPNPATRIADLRGWLPEAEKFYQKVSKSDRMPSARLPQQ